MFVFGGNNSGIRDDYKINNSLRFRSSASAYLSRTPASNGDRQKWTFSCWVKRGASGVRQGIFIAQTSGSIYWGVEFDANNALNIYDSNSGGTTALTTTALYRDFGAWYHIVVAIDTTQATASNRCIIYVNGIQVTSFGTTNYPTQNSNTQVNTASVAHRIGNWVSSSLPLDGYLTEINFIDGQALTPSSFGYTHPKTGVWRPKPFTGTYGTNGFYLKFSDIATTSGSNAGLGKDFSGNGNYWTTNNISVTSGSTYDAMTDSPTLGASASNYCVLNPVFPLTATPLNGNMRLNSGDKYAIGTILVKTGKWYAEATLTAVGAFTAIGITGDIKSGSSYAGQFAGDNGYTWTLSGTYATNGGSSSAGATPATGDVVGMAWDADAGTLQFYRNGTALGTSITGITAGIDRSWSINGRSTGGANDVTLNCGQQPFAYTPPTGYKALNTYNLPTVTIPKGNKYMDATLWTGNGSAQTITNAGAFKPDLVWWKNRNSTRNHLVFDSIRGVGNYIQTNATTAEATDAQMLTSFNSDGFTHGTAANGATNAETYVGWQWQASQGSTSSNASGSITSTVSVNASAGFSVVTYTGNGVGGSTIGHGLGVVPSMIIVKRRDTSGWDWMTKHKSLSSGNCILLNSTAAQSTLPSYGIISDLSSSTTFSVTTGSINANQVNASGATYVAYCWAEIAGFSKFGSYTGNGSADGPFVYLGFRPKFIMFKSSSVASTEWQIYDSSRQNYNVSNVQLLAHSSAAESTTTNSIQDILSNGFKIRATGTHVNSSGGTYIYMAFAENPFKYSLAR